MYGSGSTWTYNAVRKIAAAVHPGRPVVAGFVAEERDIPASAEPRAITIVKSHAGPATPVLAARAERILITVRDPRDAVASMTRHNNLSFDEALALTEASARICAALFHDRRTMRFRYEDGFVDNLGTLDRIAASFGGVLTAADHARIFAETRRPAVERFIADLPALDTSSYSAERDDLFDTVSHWHRHHAGRTGKVGRWRDELDEAQVEEIIARLGDWMAQSGYHAPWQPQVRVRTPNR